MLIPLKIAILKSNRKSYEIARSMGWHASKISSIIAETYVPDSIEKEELARELGTTVEALFNPDKKAAV